MRGVSRQSFAELKDQLPEALAQAGRQHRGPGARAVFFFIHRP